MSSSQLDSRGYQKELQTLYARRLAIDSLIRSLQNYDRFRVLSEEPKRRLA